MPTFHDSYDLTGKYMNHTSGKEKTFEKFNGYTNDIVVVL